MLNGVRHEGLVYLFKYKFVVLITSNERNELRFPLDNWVFYGKLFVAIISPKESIIQLWWP